jgi:hypothetical protein
MLLNARKSSVQYQCPDPEPKTRKKTTGCKVRRKNGVVIFENILSYASHFCEAKRPSEAQKNAK